MTTILLSCLLQHQAQNQETFNHQFSYHKVLHLNKITMLFILFQHL